MSESRIEVEVEAPIGWITFNHPERRNAMSFDMWRALPDAVQRLENDAAVRVVVLRGGGEEAFVSGADISQFESRRSGGDASKSYEEASAAANRALAGCSKPTVAMIRGFCLGGGLGLALDCDLRIAADDAVFGIPAARLGVGYGHVGLARLLHLVGPARSKEILFLARRYDAAEALAMGLLNTVVGVEALEATVRDLAATLADNAPLTQKAAKVVVDELCRGAAADLERCRQVVADCFESEDYAEGRRAFMEKRRPEFQGR